MLRKPQLKTFLTLFPISPTVWGVRGGPEEVWRLKVDSGDAMRLLGRLLPMLTGQHERGEIIETVSLEGFSSAATDEMLTTLEQAGLLEDADPHGLPPSDVTRFADQIAFFSRFTNSGGARDQALLKTRRVGIFGSGKLCDCIENDLRDAGVGEIIPMVEPKGTPPNGDAQRRDFRRSPRGTLSEGPDNMPWPDREPPHLLVCAEQEHNPSVLEFVDTCSRTHRVPWILVRATDVHEGCVGPLFVPGETASYASFECRLRSNVVPYVDYQAFDEYARHTGHGSASAGGLHSSCHLLSGIAVVEAIKYLTGVLPPALAGRMLTVNFVTWESELHYVLSMPRIEKYASLDRHFPWKDMRYAHEQQRRS